MATNLADLQTAQGNTNQPRKKAAFPALLQQSIAEIKRALPQHCSADRMSRIALTAFRRTPKLGNCDPRSVLAAVIQSAQLGLEPDTLGRAYLIPYGTECQFIPGWKGLVDLMNRSGQGTVWTGAVFDGDFFEYELGDSPHVKHRPKGDDDPDKMICAYAIGRVKGAEWPVIEVWNAARIRRHRDRYNKVGKKHYSYENWEMYARKVVLLQVLKYMPASAEMARAIALNDAAEFGAQKLNIDDAIDGVYVPVSEPEKETGGNAASNEPEKNSEKAAQQVGGGNPFANLSAKEFVERIAACETEVRVDELLDVVRSMHHLTAAEAMMIAEAADNWKAGVRNAPQQKSRGAPRQAVD